MNVQISSRFPIFALRPMWIRVWIISICLAVIYSTLYSVHGQSQSDKLVPSEPIQGPESFPSSGSQHPEKFCLLVEASGVVEVLGPDRKSWNPVKPGHKFILPCRLRTAPDSRAGIQFSDKSIIRLAPGTWMDIRNPNPQKNGHFKLLKGKLFFFNRERPGSIDFSTPLATGAIRGTEFVLEADESLPVNTLTLIDGQVVMDFESGEISIDPGQILTFHQNGTYRIEALDRPESSIQWVLYYPHILDPAEIEKSLTAGELSALSASLDRARVGNFREAFQSIPSGFTPQTPSALTWVASLYLAAGQIDMALTELSGVSANSGEMPRAVTELVMAVQGTVPEVLPAVDSASGNLARSYILQSRSHLVEALNVTRTAVSISPDFGAGWIRLAELNLMLERFKECEIALAMASQLSPENPYLHTIRGFHLLALRDVQTAELSFTEAIRLDNSMGLAWLGQALCAFRTQRDQLGRQRMQMAVALEPQRSLFRSYLAKSYAETGEDQSASKEFIRAVSIDPADPTPHHYASLWHLRNNDVIRSVSELEKAVELNDNQSIFRSRLQLDRDESMRSADLASVYRLAGLPIPGFRRASRSIRNSYTDYGSHLFAAQSYRAFEDPYNFDLRYESPRQSEWFIANLLAPGAGINLSQAVVEQRSLNFLSTDPWNGLVSTTWRDNGDWQISASAYGSGQKFSYALDHSWQSFEGFNPNANVERNSLTLRMKYSASTSDSLYLELGHDRRHGGDPVNRSAPAATDQTFRYTEKQFPTIFTGYTRRWNENHTTLLAGGYIQDDLITSSADQNTLFLPRSGGQFNGITTLPLTSGRLQSDFDLLSGEIQHIWSIQELTTISGLRYQSGNAQNAESLSRTLTGPIHNQVSSYDFSRLSAYLYGLWSPIDRLTLTAGISYDDISHPYNSDLLPLSHIERSHQSLAPKFGLDFDVSEYVQFRSFYTEYSSGLYFDNSFSIQPNQIAGFNQSYRSLIPESVSGIFPAAEIQAYGGGLDYTSPSKKIFAGIEMVISKSHAARGVGALTNSGGLPIPDSTISLDQKTDFRENQLTAYLNHLAGDFWTLGMQYSLVDSRLESRFPLLPDTLAGLESLESIDNSLLFRSQFSVHFNHPAGWFGRWASGWDRQINSGPTAGESFWRHDLILGYRFPQRRLEIMAGIENLADETPRFNALNYPRYLSPRRTFTIQAVLAL